MRASWVVALSVVVLGAGAAGAASAPRLASPRTATVGQPYTVVVAGAATRPDLTVRRGAVTKRPRAARAGAGRWRASVTLTAAGAWSVSAKVGSRRFTLGSIDAQLGVQNAVRLAVTPDGMLLVADSKAKRILRLDPANGRRAVLAAGLDRLISVTTGSGGTVYATADERVWKLDAGRTEVEAGAGDPPLDLAASGDALYVSRYGPHVDRLAAGERTRYAGFDRPHGVTTAPGGGVYVADTYAGAIRRISANGSVSTVATGFQLPVDVAVTADGALLVADIGAQRVARIDGSHVSTVAANAGSVTSVVVAAGKVYVSAIEGPYAVARLDVASGKLTRIA